MWDLHPAIEMLGVVAAVGAALTVLKVWVWKPAAAELDLREDMKIVVAALTPDHGESVADFIAETRSTAARVEAGLTAHVAESATRIEELTWQVGATNHRLDRALELLAGAPRRKSDGRPVGTAPATPRRERSRNGEPDWKG